MLKKVDIICDEQGDYKALMIDTTEKSYSLEKLKAYRRIYAIIGFIGKPLNNDRFFIHNTVDLLNILMRKYIIFN